MSDNIEFDSDLDIINDRIKDAELYLSVCIREVMGTSHGRHFALWLLETNNLNGDVFDADPYIHALRSGGRAVAVALRDRLLSDCPDNYYKMCLEHKHREPEDINS